MRIRALTAPNPGPLTLSGTNSWLIGSSIVIDPGPDIASHVDTIASAAPHLATILITHRHADHAPAAVPLARRTGAAIFAPDAVLDDSVVTRRIAGGETLETEHGALRVIATPGHTAEHVCFLTDNGDLFTGDTILGSGTTAIFPPDGNMRLYIDSLRLLRALSPKTIYPAHGPVRSDAVALIDEYIAHRMERERQIVEAIAEGASDVRSIRRAVYPTLDTRLEEAAEIQISAHVLKLVDEGRVDSAVLSGRRPRNATEP